MAIHQKVWVAYSDEQHQIYQEIDFVEGLTAWQAIEQSGILTKISLTEPYHLGNFGLKIQPDTILQAGDRVEIYRPLKINPKEIRRNRAEKNPTSRYLVKQRARGNRFRHQGDID